MPFNQHFELQGFHAKLSPSKGSWVNYDEDKMARVFLSQLSAAQGTKLHNLAKDLILLGVKLPDTKKTLNAYVNDAIGYKMTPELVLAYTPPRNVGFPVCFGSADAVAFKRNKLRVHDLKTGLGETSVRQLEIYAALFCLEYGYKPFEIEIELRIYQNDEKRIYEGDPDVIMHHMDKIITFDQLYRDMAEEEAF